MSTLPIFFRRTWNLECVGPSRFPELSMAINDALATDSEIFSWQLVQ
jgi:hypothetical protein